MVSWLLVGLDCSQKVSWLLLSPSGKKNLLALEVRFVSPLAALKFEREIKEDPCIIRDGDGLNLHRSCLISSQVAHEQLSKNALDIIASI